MTLARRTETTWPSLFERFFNNDLKDWNISNFSGPDNTLPAVNVHETDNDYILEVAAPGMNKDDFKINYQNNTLTISAERKKEKEDKRNNYSRMEFSYHSFRRSFTVPGNEVESENISANYVDGILSVKIPKREEVKPKPAREITIS